MRRWAMTVNMTMRAAVAVTAQPGGGHREQPAGAKNQADQIDTHVGTEANAKPMFPGETQASLVAGESGGCHRLAFTFDSVYIRFLIRVLTDSGHCVF